MGVDELRKLLLSMTLVMMYWAPIEAASVPTCELPDIAAWKGRTIPFYQGNALAFQIHLAERSWFEHSGVMYKQWKEEAVFLYQNVRFPKEPLMRIHAEVTIIAQRSNAEASFKGRACIYNRVDKLSGKGLVQSLFQLSSPAGQEFAKWMKKAGAQEILTKRMLLGGYQVILGPNKQFQDFRWCPAWEYPAGAWGGYCAMERRAELTRRSALTYLKRSAKPL